MRIRLTFSKTEAMRYTGHLDVYRTVYRTLIRAKLPLSHSEGYARRPKINLAAPLPLGITSDCEIADLFLDAPLSLEEIEDAIHQASPPGLLLQEISEVAPSSPKLQTTLFSAEFIAVFLEPIPDLDSRVDALLNAETLERKRRGKLYDLRPLIIDIQHLEDSEEGHQRLHMTLLAKEGAMGRADEVLLALGIDPAMSRLHRKKINFIERT